MSVALRPRGWAGSNRIGDDDLQRRRLARARLQLLAADTRWDDHAANDFFPVIAGLLRFQRRHPRAAQLLSRAVKAVAWTATGQLPRYLRAAQRERSAPPPPRHDVGETTAGAAPLPGATAAPGAGWVLIADQEVCKPDRDAGSRCTLSIIRAFRAAGWAVSLWAYDRKPGGRYSAELEALGVEVLDARWTGGLGDWLDRYGARLDHVMLLRPRVARDLLPAVLPAVTCPISYQGVDLHFSRIAMQAQQLDDPLLRHAANQYLALERRIWRVVDVVLYLSEEEAAEVRRLEPGVDARAITPFTFERFITRRTPPAEKTILFVGGFGHAPNEDAVRWFVADILPAITRQHRDARLVVVGANPPDTVRALAGPHVAIAGGIDQAALAAAYGSTRVTVAPLRVGAGVKGKVVEAMAEGVPVVTTPVGAQGLPGLADIVPVQDDPASFAAAVNRLLDDDTRWLLQSAAQTRYATRHFSPTTLRKTLFAAIDGE